MALALPTALLTLGLLAQVPSPQGASSAEAGARSIVLTAEVTEAPVRIQPERATVILLGTGLRAERIVLEAREHFEVAELGAMGQSLTLLAGPALERGARLKAELHLEGARGPRLLRLLLEVVREGANDVVRVQSETSADSCRETLDEERKRRLWLEEENARLRVASQKEIGLADVVASGVASKGIQVRELDGNDTKEEGTALMIKGGLAYRAKERVAVEVFVRNAKGAASLRAVGAELRAPDGTRLRVMRVLQDEPIPGGAMGWVVVEAEAPDGLADLPYELELWGEGGTERASLPEVRFPPAPLAGGAQPPGGAFESREEAEEARKNPVPHVRH